MTNSQSRMLLKTNPSMGHQQYVPPAIPLEQPERKKYKKDKVLSLKLRSNPNDEASQTYELTVPFFWSRMPEEWLLVKKSIIKILARQNVTAWPEQFAMTRRILDGDALAQFNAKATKLGTETATHHVQCLNAVTEHVFPQRSLQYQCQYMRCYLRKLNIMKTRIFNARL